jgi:hypothetical protein
MKTRENAPRRRGSTSMAASSTERSSSEESRLAMTPVSLVAVSALPLPLCSVAVAGVRSFRSSTRSWVLVRLPLWASATEPLEVGRNVGCAFCHTLEPVVL